MAQDIPIYQTNWEIESILHWPGTPTSEELELANEMYQRLQPGALHATADPKVHQAMSDTANLQVIRKQYEPFGRWASDTYSKRSGQFTPDDQRRQIFNLINSIVCTPDDEDLMGALITFHGVPGDRSTLIFGFTMLQRNTRWMGVNPLLEKLEGTSAMVLESPTRKGRIGGVICMPEGYWRKGIGGQPFDKSQEATTLSTILAYHGTTAIEWMKTLERPEE